VGKAELESALSTLDIWLIIFGVFVAIGVVGESAAGYLHWRKSGQLSKLQTAENLSLQEAIAGANARAADAYSRARQAELELAKIQTPRTLTPDQQEKLIKLLTAARKGPTAVSAAFVDSTDAKEFAKSIKTVLTKSGFILSDPPKSLMVLSYSKPGAWIFVRDLKHAPPHATAIQNAFGAIGVFLEGFAKPEAIEDADMVVIAVSSHPLKPDALPPELISRINPKRE
jgi:hypothetical protein